MLACLHACVVFGRGLVLSRLFLSCLVLGWDGMNNRMGWHGWMIPRGKVVVLMRFPDTDGNRLMM